MTVINIQKKIIREQIIYTPEHNEAGRAELSLSHHAKLLPSSRPDKGVAAMT